MEELIPLNYPREGKMIAVELKSVTKEFSNKTILSDVSFEFIEKGKYLIKGHNGCGKTTLLNIISGYDTDFKGEVKIQGNIKYLYQDDLLFGNLSVEENLKLICIANDNKLGSGRNSETIDEGTRKKIAQSLDLIGIENQKGQLVNSLSGGERKKVLLASLLLTEAEIVLLDEPMASVDYNSKIEFVKLLSKFFDERTIIMVSHEFEDELKGYEIVTIKDGRLL